METASRSDRVISLSLLRTHRFFSPFSQSRITSLTYWMPADRVIFSKTTSTFSIIHSPTTMFYERRKHHCYEMGIFYLIELYKHNIIIAINMYARYHRYLFIYFFIVYSSVLVYFFNIDTLYLCPVLILFCLYTYYIGLRPDAWRSRLSPATRANVPVTLGSRRAQREMAFFRKKTDCVTPW